MERTEVPRLKVIWVLIIIVIMMGQTALAVQNKFKTPVKKPIPKVVVKKPVQKVSPSKAASKTNQSKPSVTKPISVVPKVENIQLTIPNTLAVDGTTQAITNITMNPKDAKVPNISYKSSDDDIASIDNNGNIKANKEGTVEIIVTANNVVAKSSLEIVPSIISIEDIQLNVYQGDNCVLPTVINAKMSDGNQKEVSVTWQNNYDTNTLGTLTLNGIVDGYSGQVNLSLNVLSKVKIASIDDINLYVKQGKNCTLPTVVNAKLSDGNQKEVPVTWRNNYDTNILGTWQLYGTVDGYNGYVNLYLIVSKNLVELTQDQINAYPKVFKGFFKNTSYDNPNDFLYTGVQTESSDLVKSMAANFNDKKDISTIQEIYSWIHSNLSLTTNRDKFARLGKDIIAEKTFTGCTDMGLAFATLSRAKGIPTVFVQTGRIDWIKKVVTNAPIDLIVGHILVEVLLSDNKWYLVDSTAGKLYLDYDRNNFSLPDGFYVFAKSIEVFDTGIRNELDNAIKTNKLFEDFDVSKYVNPKYDYIDLMTGVNMKSQDFTY